MRNKPGRPELRPNPPTATSTTGSTSTQPQLNDRNLYHSVQNHCSKLLQNQLKMRSRQPSWIKNGPLAVYQNQQLQNLFSSLPPKQQMVMLKAIQDFMNRFNQPNRPAVNNQPTPPTPQPNLNPSDALNLQLNPAGSEMLNRDLANQELNNIEYQNLQNLNLQQDLNLEEENFEVDNFNDDLNQKMEEQQQPSPQPGLLEEDDFQKIKELKEPVKEVHKVEIFKDAIEAFSKHDKTGLIKALSGSVAAAEEHGFDFKSTPKLTR